MSRFRHALRRVRHDDGFTLVEVSVAVLVAAILLTSLTLMLGNTIRSVRDNRAQEQATVVALGEIEFARSVDWTELALDPIVAPLDPRLLSPLDRKLVGATIGLAGDEDLVEDAAGLIPYQSTESFDNQNFTIYQYVTEVEPELRRVVVVVEWQNGTSSHEHFTSTLISEVSAR